MAVFIWKTNGILVIIIVYVNNIAIIGPLRQLINKFKYQLTEKFEIEDNSLISLFLGLKVIQNWLARILTLSQKVYIELLVKEFLNREKVNSKPTLLEPNQHLEPNLELVDKKL